MDRVFRPPAYAWDWFARQRLLWREARRRLAVGPHETAPRYRATEAKPDVLALLRADYPRDEHVRRTVLAVLSEFAFLDRTDVPFADLGARNPPRGMRWWWTAITGEELETAAVATATRPEQLTLDDVHEGFGG